MQEDDEPIVVEVDTRKWWQGWRLTMAPGWQGLAISSGIFAAIAALRHLH